MGQAVACHVSGVRVIFRRCRFLGFQDTLYTFGENTREYYEEYQCYGEGAKTTGRVSWSHQLTNDADYAIPVVLGGQDGWNPLAKE